MIQIKTSWILGIMLFFHFVLNVWIIVQGTLIVRYIRHQLTVVMSNIHG